MNLQNLLPTLDVRHINHDLAIESPRSEQRRIENIRAVGGGDQYHPFSGLETIHFNQKLVQCLLPFVMTTPQTGAAVAANGIDLIQEDDARSIFQTLREHIPHPGRSYPDEHLNEVRTGKRKERDIGFPGYRFGQKRLPGPGGTDQNYPLGDPSAQPLEFLRIL
jgi:hypothetical protein